MEELDVVLYKGNTEKKPAACFQKEAEVSQGRRPRGAVHKEKEGTIKRENEGKK